MNKKLITLLLSIFAFGTSAVLAQGKWNGESNTSFKYIFLESLLNKKDKFKGGSELSQYVASAESKSGFLPAPSSGSAKVSIEPNTGASFAYTGKGDDLKLRAIASSSKATHEEPASVSKFSIYGIKSSAVTSFFFTLDINAFAQNGEIIIPFGNTPDNAPDNGVTFNNSKQMSEWWDNEHLFGSIKLDVYDGVWIAYSYRRPRIGKLDTQAPRFVELKGPTPFIKGKSHQVEIYCNNSETEQIYTRNGKSYIVLPQTYQWWVNDRKIVLDGDNYNFPATDETPKGAAINSFSINTSGSSKPVANALEVTISNISAHYVE
ncbi:hypothetical protein [Pseudopedobacter beijingensis]|uniref:Uncharacterized protein n=1 Tax=Pseudopedobacter beijingensis TaxID=1207056 RepID=A0ABW4IGI0_9SPHI